MNVFVSTYINAQSTISPLPRILAHFFVGMFFMAIPIQISVDGSLFTAFRHRFWAAAIYTACLPNCAWLFIKHLFFEPCFDRTPKGRSKSPKHGWTAVRTSLIGVVGQGLAIVWWSPFSPLLSSFCMAWISFPAYCWLHEDGVKGTLARIVIWIPGCLALFALFLMWAWSMNYAQLEWYSSIGEDISQLLLMFRNYRNQ